MYSEFGSEFWIDQRNRTTQKSRDYLFEEGEIFTNSGRSCLSLLLAQLDHLPRKALLPVYTCESVTLPFIAYGYEVAYYDIDKHMQPDVDQILNMTKREPVILVHMSHFGFPTNRNLNKIMTTLRDRGCVIIEDVTHSLFNEDVSEAGDCKIASIRKWLGIPSGGVVLPGKLRGRLHPIHTPPLYEFYHNRALAMEEKGAILEGKVPVTKNRNYHALFRAAEDALYKDCRPYSIDSESLDVLLHLDAAYLRNRRRENFLYLLENLTQTGTLQPVFSSLPPACCPLFFPVYVDDDNRHYQRCFSQQNLFCPIHWPHNPYIQGDHAGLDYIESHILSIPCDQRYQLADMAQVIHILTRSTQA